MATPKQPEWHPLQLVLKAKAALERLNHDQWTLNNTKDHELFKQMVECVENLTVEKPPVVQGQFQGGDLDLDLQFNDQVVHAGILGGPKMVELWKYATPAPFGRGSKTILDKEVRHAYEIGARHILRGKSWETALENLNAQVSKQMGIPLKAELYKLHIYPKGGHFDKHQDTPHAANHVGTLVVVLPVSHMGGTLHVEDQELKRGQTYDALNYMAFYNDCVHWVDEVTAGDRVVLQFDLYLSETSFYHETEAASSVVCWHERLYFEPKQKPFLCSPADTLKKLVQQYFKEMEENQAESSLGFLLSREYPLCYLNLETLKGVDRALYLLFKDEYQMTVQAVVLHASHDYDDCCESVTASPFYLEDMYQLLKDEQDTTTTLQGKKKRSAVSHVDLVPPHSSAQIHTLESQASGLTGNEAIEGYAIYFSGVLVISRRSETEQRSETETKKRKVA